MVQKHEAILTNVRRSKSGRDECRNLIYRNELFKIQVSYEVPIYTREENLSNLLYK